MQLEVSFETLAELEQFWGSIPPEPHKAWSQDLQAMIVHGSPTWEVFRTVDAFPASDSASSGAAAMPREAAGGGLVVASGDEIDKFGQPAEPSLPSTAETTPSGLSVVTSEEEADVVLDWKGDPMKINPGDKLPFRF